MRSFGISSVDGRIIEARWFSVSRADCVLAKLAGGRDPANTTVSALTFSSGSKRNGSYRRQELT
jgi:hypothetical protein